MKIEGLFLRSRAGRRIFWTLFVAAAVPIGLFAVFTQDALRSHFAHQAMRQQVQAAKYAGLLVLDNLLVARTVLEVVARHGSIDGGINGSTKRGRVLAGVAELSRDGRLIAGDAAVWRRWQDRTPAQHAEAQDHSPGLIVVGSGTDGSRAAVLLALRLDDRSDRQWIAEVDPDFLFDEASAQGDARWICVRTVVGQRLNCPTSTAAAERGASDSAKTLRWSLFLRADFGVDDWIFEHTGPVAAASLDAFSLTRTAALGALATVLVVTMLGLIQVRRTMVPLERLIQGTRRLARRDYAARVSHDSADEFGELARSFNHMAAQIGHQVEALELQSAIDREILNGLDMTRILQQVARRLAQVVPGARAAVIEVDRSGSDLSKVYGEAGLLALVHLPSCEPVYGGADQIPGLQRLAALPPTLSDVLAWTDADVTVRPIRHDGVLVALLLLGLSERQSVGDDETREIQELGDRVAVTLAAADRERRLVERATLDGLTGLVNRGGLLDALDRCLSAGSSVSLLFLDLDRFKEVNDTMGHHAGDELLREIARRLRRAAPSNALVARPGGDEFVLMVPGPRPQAQALADSLVPRVAEPILLQGRSVAVAASIGMAHAPEDGTTASDLLRRADMAMYTAKREGGHRVAWFTATMDQRLAQRAALLSDLRGALDRREFELHFQPRRHVQSGAIHSAEALLRWRHPVRGLVSPVQFVPLLEETGHIDAVGTWVLEEACARLHAWRAQHLGLQTVAVNVSTRQLHDPGFVDRVIGILRRHDLPAAALELEVTESIFVGDASPAIGRLHALSAAGVKVALDDFGTGYSSLSYLQKLPITILKVDRSFVVDVVTKPTAQAVTRSIVALGRALNLQVVAEGVETEAQARCLIDLGCDELQGYLVARPIPADDVPAFLNRHAAGIDPIDSTITA